MKREGVMAGASDLILLVPNTRGQILCIEMKTDRGRQSEAQKEFQSSIENVGNKYVICKSIDEFIRQVNGHLSE